MLVFRYAPFLPVAWASDPSALPPDAACSPPGVGLVTPIAS
jgi:hypothetical protein